MQNPLELPNQAKIIHIEEPMADINIMTQKEYSDDLISNLMDRRAE